MAPPYLRTLMAVLPPMSRPSVAVRDLMAFLRQRSRDQIIPACLAELVTMINVIVFLVDSKINTAPPTQINYVENYASNRTEAETRANIERAAAERARREAARQADFQNADNQLNSLGL